MTGNPTLEKLHIEPLLESRPIPDDLVELLKRVRIGERPPGTTILASKGVARRRARSIAISAIAFVVFCFLEIGAGALDLLESHIWIGAILGYFFVLLVFNFVEAIDLRQGVRKGSHHLILSDSYIAITGDPSGIQWARLSDLAAVSSASTPTSKLELVFWGGEIEKVFLDEMPTDELGYWAAACTEALPGCDQRAA